MKPNYTAGLAVLLLLLSAGSGNVLAQGLIQAGQQVEAGTEHYTGTGAGKVHMDQKGLLNERTPGDPLYWDAGDPRPWGTWYTESDKRYEQYKKTQGK